MREVAAFDVGVLVEATRSTGREILGLKLPLKHLESDQLKAKRTLAELVKMRKGAGDRIWHEEDGKLYLIRTKDGVAEWVDNICPVPGEDDSPSFAVGDWAKYVDHNDLIRVGRIEAIGKVDGKKGIFATLAIPDLKHARHAALGDLRSVTQAEIPLVSPTKKVDADA